MMHAIGHDDVDNVQVTALDELPIVADHGGFRVGLASGLSRFFRRLGNRHELRVFRLRNRGGVVLSPGAVADDSKTHG